MKKHRLNSFYALFIFFFCFAFIGCDNDPGPGSEDELEEIIYKSMDSDGNYYVLKITEQSGRYVTQIGDKFTLTITTSDGTSKICSGTVSSIVGTILKLQSSKGGTFEATISTNDLSGINGTIKFNDATTIELVSFQLQPTYINDDGKGIFKQNWFADRGITAHMLEYYSREDDYPWGHTEEWIWLGVNIQEQIHDILMADGWSYESPPRNDYAEYTIDKNDTSASITPEYLPNDYRCVTFYRDVSENMIYARYYIKAKP